LNGSTSEPNEFQINDRLFRIEKQWKKKVHDIYESCKKCGYSWGHANLIQNNKRIHHKCPKCRTMMSDLSIDEKESILKYI